MVPLKSWPGVGLVAIVTLGLAALAAVLSLGALPAVIVILGWMITVPVLSVLTYYEDDADEAPVDSDPVATLRERYASGELTEAEFERRLNRLLETEDAVEEPAGQRERHDPVRER